MTLYLAEGEEVVVGLRRVVGGDVGRVVNAIVDAVDKVLNEGLRTADLARGATKALSTTQMTDEIIKRL